MVAERTALLEKRKPKTEPPGMFEVLLLNDDFTPMDFVVKVLEKFFSKNREQAVQLMLKVHVEGKAVCGVYPRDIAETKVANVLAFAQAHEHPLKCVMEEKK